MAFDEEATLRATREVIPLKPEPEAPPPRAEPGGRLRPSPEDLLVFTAVARQGGVRRGAEALRIPRSTVSRQLANLERVLGGKLIARSTRRFALTDLGRALLEQGARLEEVLRATEDIAGRAAREPSGVLRVAASPIIGEEFFPQVVADYLARFPKMQMEVKLSIDFVDLRQAGIDVAVRTGPLQNVGDLYATRLGASPKGLYASRAYLKRRGTPQEPGELKDHECIVVGTRRAVWTFGNRAAEVHVPVSGSLRVDSYGLARSAAVAGVGIAHLPSLYANGLVRAGALVPLLEASWQKTVLYAVHAAGHPAPPKIRAFIDLLRGAIKQSLVE